MSKHTTTHHVRLHYSTCKLLGNDPVLSLVNIMMEGMYPNPSARKIIQTAYSMLVPNPLAVPPCITSINFCPDNFIILPISISWTTLLYAASMNRRILLDQLLTIRSLMGSKGNAENDDSRDVIRDIAKKGMTLKKEQLTALSTEFLLTVMLDVMLLRLLDEGATVSSDPQRLMDDAAAAGESKIVRNLTRPPMVNSNLEFVSEYYLVVFVVFVWCTCLILCYL